MLILTDESIYHGIANAIRHIGRTDDTYLPSEMPDAIRAVGMVVFPNAIKTALGDGLVEMSASAPSHVVGKAIAGTGLGRLPFRLGTTVREAN